MLKATINKYVLTNRFKAFRIINNCIFCSFKTRYLNYEAQKQYAIELELSTFNTL